MVVELILIRENTKRGACEWSDDHWVGDRSPLQKDVVNVEPFMNCGKQESCE